MHRLWLDFSQLSLNATKSKPKSDTDCMQMNELEMKGNKALSCGVENETESVFLCNVLKTFGFSHVAVDI